MKNDKTTTTTVKIPGHVTHMTASGKRKPCGCGQCPDPGRPDLEGIREHVRDLAGSHIFARMIGIGDEHTDGQIDQAFECLSVIEYALSLEKTKLT